MKTYRNILLVLAAAAVLAGCGERKKALLPNVSGKAGEVLVVMEKSDWEGAPGNAVRDTLASDCPFLPQKEPLYTLVPVTPSNFTSLFQVHRNILFLTVNQKTSEESVRFFNDVWARPQIVIKVEASTPERLAEVFEENKVSIATAIEQAERDRVIANSILYEETNIRPVLSERFGGILHFPKGYVVRKISDDFVWVACETQYTNQGVLIYKYPVGKDPFSLQSLVAKRNEFLQKYVPGMFDGTYMVTSPLVDPQLKYLKYKGRDYAEMRGYWEVHGDFMGGPFVSHSFYSRDGRDIITIDAFVYAPRYDKRHYLRQVEALLYSYEWTETGN